MLDQLPDFDPRPAVFTRCIKTQAGQIGAASGQLHDITRLKSVFPPKTPIETCLDVVFSPKWDFLVKYLGSTCFP